MARSIISNSFTIGSSGFNKKSIVKFSFEELLIHLPGEVDLVLGLVLQDFLQRFGEIVTSGPVWVDQYLLPDNIDELLI